MPKGATIPKGRLIWPREVKPRSEETVLVFAEGRQADEAKHAGAHVVGGLELADDVGVSLALLINGLHGISSRLSADVTIRPPSFACRTSFVLSHRNLGNCSAREVSCLRKGEGL